MKVEITPQAVEVKIRPPTVQIGTGTPVVKEYIDAPAYTGAYTVTPTQSTQTLATEGKRMTADVVVNPIPSNYGLITWDGTALTVS